MKNSLVLKDEIYIATHQWYLILVFLLTGSLMGFLAAHLYPSPYRAVVEISVELNPYRVAEDDYLAEFAQVEFRNVDDYKYWQMQQLNTLVFSEEYLGQTLNHLKQADPYWQNVNISDLRGMLKVYWRNAGMWRLAAEHADPIRARQSVEVWRDVILERTNAAIDHAQELYRLDLELKRMTAELLETQLKQAQLIELEQTIRVWREHVGQFSNMKELSTLEHWRLWSLAAQASGYNARWVNLLASFPSQVSPTREYLPWIEKLLVSVEQELEMLQVRQEYLKSEKEAALLQWKETIQRGQGLAATLSVKSLSESEPTVRKLRPTELTALVGAVMGVLIWAGLFLLKITKSKI